MQLFVDFYGFFDLVLRGCLLATQALVGGGVSFLAFVIYPLSATLGAETDQLIHRCLAFSTGAPSRSSSENSSPRAF
jgi:putative copper resistance protein D